jgi:peptidyl-prolyl cis-trans isomerase B (cyclophilin B)
MPDTFRFISAVKNSHHMKRTLLVTLLLAVSLTTYAQKTKVVIETDLGRIVLALYDGTPKHRDNMIKLVKEHFYDSTLFHRVIPGFVIQGGDPDSKRAKAGVALGEGDVGYRIPAEIDSNYYHKRGAVGMARDGNPEKASSGCQFYIVVGKKFTDEELDNAEKRSGHHISAAHRTVYKTIGGTPHLDGNYTVFGEVIEGMDVADKIAAAARNTTDRPNKDIPMRKVYLKKKKHFLFF